MSREVETVLEVEGMTCGSCVRHINQALGELAGVRAVDVKMREGKVVVQHDAASAPLALLIESLEEAGYTGRSAG